MPCGQRANIAVFVFVLALLPRRPTLVQVTGGLELRWRRPSWRLDIYLDLGHGSWEYLVEDYHEHSSSCGQIRSGEDVRGLLAFLL